MKKKTLISTLAMLAIVFSLSGLSGNLCYAEQQWSIQIEPMYMDVFGNDQHQANIVTTTTTTTFSPASPAIRDDNHHLHFYLYHGTESIIKGSSLVL